jgi:hypothetical protein
MNKGIGAGGSNTNYYGKMFEEKTNNYKKLLELGYIENKFSDKSKYNYYLSKKYDDKTVIFTSQNGLKKYMKYKYDIDLFRCPDEAYIIEYTSGKIEIKILEKKEQNTEGSVETKLWAATSLKREYELVVGDSFDVFYCLCVSKFLQDKLLSQDKKYFILNKIFIENNITVLYGDDENYFELLDKWINNSL